MSDPYVWAHRDQDGWHGWEDVKLITTACAHRLHEWCADVPTSLTKCECPCHAGALIDGSVSTDEPDS